MAWEYRPITDTWLLARPKLKGKETYYGAYPAGFLERARRVLGAAIWEPMLHVCGGKARFYPYKNGFGPDDKTLDLDEAVFPDFVQDAREPWPKPWKAILCDPPYSPEEAKNYKRAASCYPEPEELLNRAAEALFPGGKVGILHYKLPGYPKKLLQQIGIYTIYVGNGNRARTFSVFEKIS